jgi:signal transduction histidine kinase
VTHVGTVVGPRPLGPSLSPGQFLNGHNLGIQVTDACQTRRVTTLAAVRPPIIRSLGLALLSVAVAVAALGGAEIALLERSNLAPLWVVLLFPAVALAYATAGLVAWWRRPNNRMGTILLFGGALWLLTGLANSDLLALSAVGVVLASMPLAVVVHLVMGVPSGKLRSAVSRWTVVVAYGVCLVLQVPLYLFASGASPNGVLAVADRPALVEWGVWTQRSVGMAMLAVAAVVLGARLRAATPRQRRVLAPLYGYGVLVVPAVPLMAIVVQPLTGMSPSVRAAVQVGALSVAAVAFAVAILTGGFARTAEIQELSAWLGSVADPPALSDALARALGDDSLELAFWEPSGETYVDAEGHPFALPGAGSGRGAVEVELSRRRIGAIVYDAAVMEEPALVAAAGRVVAIAIERQRLSAQLLASNQQLQQSRARIVEAADRERTRIAQNLHDGLQAQLVLVALEAQRLATVDGIPAPAVEAATALRARIDAVAAELRGLVHSVMPAPLIERGLEAATEDLVDRMPIPTSLALEIDGPLPTAVQSTAYFIVAEGLTNAVRHSRARTVAVRLAHCGRSLTIEVRDDGVGGAAPGAGLGLGGLADRVDALGGRFRIDSPTGRGTHLLADLPCGS